MDVNKHPSAEENPVPNPDDGDIFDNVEDLQRELIMEQAKNRDLNQTISDILERMEDMEKNIMRNEEKITDNQSSVLLLSRDVDDLQEDVERNSANITKVSVDVEENVADITTLGTIGTWCATKFSWYTVGTITYDGLTFSDSNMYVTETPLDINTGNYCHM